MTKDSPYDLFAWVYNRHWGGDFSRRVYPVIERHVLDRLNPGAPILDLACGTGQLAHLISEKGFRVVGLDQSEEMLRYARTNAPDCEFRRADARDFRLEKPVHAAVCTYDSLNHVPTADELAQVFRNVWSSLENRGWFLFDLNMETGYASRWNGSFHILEADHAVIVQASYSPIVRLGRVDLAIFRQAGDSWNRTDLTLTQHCYDQDQIRTGLRNAGFEEVRTMDAQKELGMANEIGRSFFLVQK